MKVLIKKVLFLILCCGALTVQPLPARSAPSHPLDPYIEAAKKEGSVTLGLTLMEKSHGKPAGELYLAAFQKRYPFLKVNFKRIGGAKERERIITEMAAGIIDYDVVTVSETMVNTIVSAKLPRAVEWQKLGVPKFLIHPKNIGLSTRPPIYGIAYNRDLIPDAVAKTFTWETCTDPKWKGKTAMDDRPRHLNRLILEDAWGRAKTLDYAKRWAAVKPAMESSRITAAEKLTMGSYYMICGLPRRYVEDIRVNSESKAIGMVFPDPVPVGIGDPIYVPLAAKHPNAAILFLVWTSTPEAQNLIDQVDFTGDPRIEGSESNKALKGKKVLSDRWEDVDRSDDNLAEILQAMGIPVVR